jgi:hypothetical protein
MQLCLSSARYAIWRFRGSPGILVQKMEKVLNDQQSQLEQTEKDGSDAKAALATQVQRIPLE